MVPPNFCVCVFQAPGRLHRGIPNFLFSPHFLVPPLRIFLQSFQKWCWHVDLLKIMKRKVINDFWTRLGLCAEDPVYTKEPQIFNEFCDATKFVVMVRSNVSS